MQSIMAHVGSDFTRVRIGIGKPTERINGADWVLSRFDVATRQAMDSSIARATNVVEKIIGDGVQKAMSLYKTDPAEAKAFLTELTKKRMDLLVKMYRHLRILLISKYSNDLF